MAANDGVDLLHSLLWPVSPPPPTETQRLYVSIKFICCVQWFWNTPPGYAREMWDGNQQSRRGVAFDDSSFCGTWFNSMLVSVYFRSELRCGLMLRAYAFWEYEIDYLITTLISFHYLPLVYENNTGHKNKVKFSPKQDTNCSLKISTKISQVFQQATYSGLSMRTYRIKCQSLKVFFTWWREKKIKFMNFSRNNFSSLQVRW